MKNRFKLVLFAITAMAAAFPLYAETPATNTAVNTRDRYNDTLTPLDQGTSEMDVRTTADIRKAVLEQKGLSVEAQNVKIITRDGKVTLRGPVRSEDEKNYIAETAREIAQNVDDQLEVVSAKTNK